MVRQRLLDEARDALSSSLDLREVVAAAEPALRRLIGADYLAVGVTEPHASGQWEWVLADMPGAFFSSYAELVPHDFVLHAVLRTPNRVLRDTEMLPRAELETNLMYRRARDFGTPLEQVMSAMLQVGPERSSGISLFRGERRAFSNAERDTLQSLLPALRSAVRNCQAFAGAASRAALLEAALEQRGLAALLLAPPAKELGRTAEATRLLERWFGRAKQAELPAILVDMARELSQLAETAPALATRRVLAQANQTQLVATAHWARRSERRCLVLVLGEQPLSPALPEPWRARLTKRELEITAQIVEGRDNRYIAELLGVSLYTAKTHIGRIYQKLGFEQRAQLIAAAHRAVT
jgi:DNA-binding NarL/FixJ family response regulator